MTTSDKARAHRRRRGQQAAADAVHRACRTEEGCRRNPPCIWTVQYFSAHRVRIGLHKACVQLHLCCQLQTEPECYVRSYGWGDPVKWGTSNLVDSAEACCQQCLQFKPKSASDQTCNGAYAWLHIPALQALGSMRGLA